MHAHRHEVACKWSGNDRLEHQRNPAGGAGPSQCLAAVANQNGRCSQGYPPPRPLLPFPAIPLDSKITLEYHISIIPIFSQTILSLEHLISKKCHEFTGLKNVATILFTDHPHSLHRPQQIKADYGQCIVRGLAQYWMQAQMSTDRTSIFDSTKWPVNSNEVKWTENDRD